MKVAAHLGFHCTDQDRLTRCLQRNAAPLEELGVGVPAPQAYRPLLKEAVSAQREAGGPPGDIGLRLAEAIGAAQDRRRVLLSHPNLLGFPGRAITPEGLYAAAPRRIADLRAVLGGALAEVQLSLRNPATLIPALIEATSDADYAGIMSGQEPPDLAWADTIERIRDEAPDLPLLIWCSEDLPLIWPELLRRVADVPPDTALDGDEEMLGALLTPVGMATLGAYLKERGPLSIADRRQLTTALLERYAQPGQLEVTLDLPGWTNALVEEITDGYYSDIARIARMNGVEILAP